MVHNGLSHLERPLSLWKPAGNQAWMPCFSPPKSVVKRHECTAFIKDCVLRFRISTRANPQLPWLVSALTGLVLSASFNCMTKGPKDPRGWKENLGIHSAWPGACIYSGGKCSVMLHLLQHIRSDRFASPVTLFLVTYSLKGMFHFHSNFLLLRWHGSLSNLKDMSVLFCTLRECELILCFPKDCFLYCQGNEPFLFWVICLGFFEFLLPYTLVSSKVTAQILFCSYHRFQCFKNTFEGGEESPLWTLTYYPCTEYFKPRCRGPLFVATWKYFEDPGTFS